jgi:formate dehydrogenase major subunit
MGYSGFACQGPQEIWDEVRTVCDGARGMTYDRLDAGGLQWPCPTLEHPGTPILHQHEFGHHGPAMLQRVDYQPTPETTSPAYPFLLMTGRTLYQFNAGTMTDRTRNRELRPSDLLEISPDDATDIGVANGAKVRLVSRYGEAVLPIQISSNVSRGHLFATFVSKDVFLNCVTGPHRDRMVGTPEYKVTAVRLERV